MNQFGIEFEKPFNCQLLYPKQRYFNPYAGATRWQRFALETHAFVEVMIPPAISVALLALAWKNNSGRLVMETIHLIGAEDVGRAGSTMRSAAEDMTRAAQSMSFSLEQHQHFLDAWLQEFKIVLEQHSRPTIVNNHAPMVLTPDTPARSYLPPPGLLERLFTRGK